MDYADICAATPSSPGALTPPEWLQHVSQESESEASADPLAAVEARASDFDGAGGLERQASIGSSSSPASLWTFYLTVSC